MSTKNDDMTMSYIGYAVDSDIRYKATSGGVGSAIVKYMLDSKKADLALTFYFDQRTKRYVPKLVSQFDEYSFSGSVYQEIDFQNFYRTLFSADMEGQTIVVFALPCHTHFIKKIARKNGVNVVVIGLTCSSQQRFEATEYLLKRMNIRLDSIEHLQYRGNGWPSGIQIRTDNNKEYFIPNNGSIWTKIFHSRLFIPVRCFKCQDTLNKECDILLADPWLPGYIGKEKNGKTLFSPYTNLGNDIIENMVQNNYIYKETIASNSLYLSQRSTILRKQSYKTNKTSRDFLIKIFSNHYYRKIVLSNRIAFQLHMFFKITLEKTMLKRMHG